MKCRCPMPGTGALPTRLGAIWKWPRSTLALNDEPEWTSVGPANLTVGLGTAWVACLTACAEIVCSWLDAPQPAVVTASNARSSDPAFIIPGDRPRRPRLE